MRRLTHIDEVCILLSWALMLMYGAAGNDYFYPKTLKLNLTWDQARNHCQVCFKDLVTVTPSNIHWIASNLSSTAWIGLRKNFTTNSNFNSTTNFNFTADFNSITDFNWTTWANGDPLTFQNWYPGWPVFKSPFPRRDCCSCSCTCPATAGPTTLRYTSFTTSNVTNNFSTTEQPVTNVTGLPTNTTYQPVTAEGEIFGECVRLPMLLPDVPDPDELYIEDSCVAMLMFGAWVEKDCSDLLPFICYEENFICKATVSNVTSTSADLTWPAGPGDIDHYRVEVVTGSVPVKIENFTDTTFNSNLSDLTPGARYLVKVIPVKCGRDLNTEEVTFYTIPNKVENLTVVNVSETSVFLSWDKPAGYVESYLIEVQDNHNVTSLTVGKEVDGLTPGTSYTFNVFSEVPSKQSGASNITTITKPGKVTNLKVSDNAPTSLLLTFDPPPEGKATGFVVVAVNDSDVQLVGAEELVMNTNQPRQKVNITNLPMGTRVTLKVAAKADSRQGEDVTISAYTAPGKISNLRLETTSRSLNATWDPPATNYSSFIIKLLLNDVKQKEKTTGKGEYSVHFEDLKTAAKYKVEVYSVLENIRGDPVENSTFTKPGKVTNLKVSDNAPTSLLLTFDPPEGNATGFVVVAMNDSDVPLGEEFKELITSEPWQKMNITDLPMGTRVTLKVAAEDDGRRGEDVTISAYTAPGKISNLRLETTSHSLNATWDPPATNHSSFVIKLLLNDVKQKEKMTGKKEYSVHFEDLKTATKYKVEVYSVLENIRGYPVENSTFTKPGKVTNLKVSDNAPTSLLLTFNPPEGNATGFVVVAVNDSDVPLGEEFKELITSEPRQKMNITDLPMGTRVTLKVAAEDDGRRGEDVTISAYTAPGKISNLRLETTSHSLTATWDPPTTNHSSFIIKLLLDDVKQKEKTSGKEDYSVHFEGLKTATKYKVEVYSVLENISGYPVENSTFTKPGKVTNLKVSDNAPTSLLLTFDPPPEGNATGFVVVAVNDSDVPLGKEREKPTTDGRQKMNITDLPMGTRVTLKVAAKADTRQGEDVTISAYTAPGKISNLRLETTSHSLNATWDPPATNHSSFIIKLLLNDLKQDEKMTGKGEYRVHFESLKTAAKYKVEVYSVLENIRGDPVENSTFTKPDPPTDPRIISKKTNKTHVTFGWTAPKNIENATYLVRAKSSFWGDDKSYYVWNKTSYTFNDLKSGTKYLFEVQTVANHSLSQAVKETYVTVANKMQISLSMLCSSYESLHCDNDTTRASVLDALRKRLETVLGDRVVWSLESSKSENDEP